MTTPNSTVYPNLAIAAIRVFPLVLAISRLRDFTATKTRMSLLGSAKMKWTAVKSQSPRLSRARAP